MDFKNHIIGPFFLITSGALIILAAALWQSLPSSVAEMDADQQGTTETAVSEISVDQMGDISNPSNIVIIDIRSQETYTAGHIPGAFDIPAEQINLQSSLDVRKTYILYGDAADNSDSLSAARLFIQSGITDVKVLSGGFQAWVNAGKEIK